jgi:phospholipid/cholesterol/gamma-HCH transport system permease protein
MKSLGKYLIFLHSLFVNRESFKIYVQQILEECVAIGVESISIVVIVSMFMGAVTSIQIAYNLLTPLAGKFLVGLAVRNMTILELSPTIMAIVFAGKVGSNIASQLGSMRISEQIDALEIMGINTASYLVLPKILATIFVYPLLVIISCFLSIYSGFLASTYIAAIVPADYIYGVRLGFDPYTIRFAIYKSLTFAFLISSISSYKGFYTSGGALAVGQASTSAVTNSCIAILAADYFLTQLLLHRPT